MITHKIKAKKIQEEIKMSFNLDKIKGISSLDNLKIQDEQNEKSEIQPGALRVGAGLLQESMPEEMESKYVTVSEIFPAQENEGISISEIEELADNIYDVGVLNPPIVKEEQNGTYKIVAGERRWTACQLLIQEKRWPEDKKIRCSLFNPNLIRLNLSDDDKEEYVRLSENAEQRNKTDADILRSARKFKAIYDKLRANGELKGIKTRDLLANDLKVSPSVVAQFTKVENRGSEELIEAVLDNKVSINAAVKVADMSNEEQKDFVESIPENKRVTPQDVDKYNLKKTTIKNVETEINNNEQEDVHVITKQIFRQDTKSILKMIGNEEVKLNDQEYIRYSKAIKTVEELIKKVM